MIKYKYGIYCYFVLLSIAVFFTSGCGPNNVGSIDITTWGPNTTQAGVVFNVQPDNSAAFWVNVNQNLQSDAVMVFHGVKLHSVVSGKLVTAGVPADLYAQAGSYPLYVAEEVKGKEIISNTVYFVVHPKRDAQHKMRHGNREVSPAR